MLVNFTHNDNTFFY